MAAPRHPPAGPVCLVFWADRGPGASCPSGEGPRRALVTFPRWKVTRGSGLRSQARFDVSRRRRLLGRDGAAPQNCPQAALGPRWRSAPGKPVSTAYIETYRQAKSGLNGTFDRAKVPKARWGVSMRPRPLTTPLGDPEGPRRRASPAWWCCRYCLRAANGCFFAPTSRFRGARRRGRFVSSFGQTGVRGLPAFPGRAPGALW